MGNLGQRGRSPSAIRSSGTPEARSGSGPVCGAACPEAVRCSGPGKSSGGRGIWSIIHWKGGVHTELRLPLRRHGENSCQTSQEVVEAVRLLARICSDDLPANALNRNGLPTGRGNRWRRERITSLRSDHQIPCCSIERCESESWMNLTEAAGFWG
jgi:hypothetical protein